MLLIHSVNKYLSDSHIIVKTVILIIAIDNPILFFNLDIYMLFSLVWEKQSYFKQNIGNKETPNTCFENEESLIYLITNQFFN